jgi:hypothetical protein
MIRRLDLLEPSQSSLPCTSELTDEERVKLDLEFGLHSAAAHFSKPRTEWSYLEWGKILTSSLIALVVCYLFFPFRHFIKAPLEHRVIEFPRSRIVPSDPKVARLVDQFRQLRESGRLREAMRLGAEQLTAAGNWVPAWEDYLKLLDADKEASESEGISLSSEASRLLELDPDAWFATYYLAQGQLNAHPTPAHAIRTKDPDGIASLKRLAADCERLINSVIPGLKEAIYTRTDKERAVHALTLCAAELHERLWWASGFKWEDPAGKNREEAFKWLRDLKDTDYEAQLIRHRLFKTCKEQFNNEWLDNLFGYQNVKTRRIDDSDRNPSQVEEQIKLLHDRLRVANNGKARQ